MQELHRLVLKALPGCKLWFSDGRNRENKTVTNPTIGYGSHTIQYADGKTAEGFRIGISANKTGIAVYLPGIADKTYLARMFKKYILGILNSINFQ